MTIDSIVQSLKEEKERIENAISALEGHEGGNGRRGRKLLAGGGWSSNGRIADGGAGDGAGLRPRRRLSAAARRKISQAAKARWAKAKKAGRNSL